MKIKPINWHNTENGCDGFTPIFDFTIDTNSALFVCHCDSLKDWEFIGQGYSIDHCKEVAQNYYELRIKECIDEN